MRMHPYTEPNRKRKDRKTRWELSRMPRGAGNFTESTRHKLDTG